MAIRKAPTARTIPRPVASQHPHASERRGAQQQRTSDEHGDGMTRDRRGRSTVMADPEGPLSVDERGVRVRLAPGLHVNARREIALRSHGRWAPNRIEPASGGVTADMLNARVAELEARIEVLVRALQGAGALL